MIEVIDFEGYKKVVAEKPINKGDTVFNLEGDRSSQASKYTIQVDVQKHLNPFLDIMSEWKFVNHSCDPNVWIDTVELKMKALRNIVRGEEICFNYNTTEYEMVSPFKCNCGSDKCYGEIKGFKYLAEESQNLLLSFVAPHIKMLSKKDYLVK